MKIKLYVLLLIIPFLCSTCDILRSSQFEIISWTPGEGYHCIPEDIAVSLQFSHEPHRASVEQNFSFTGEGNNVRGSFLWEEKTLTFLPLTPLEKNVDYNISLSADARNTEGLSLDRTFNCNFTTRADNTRPVLVSCYPPMYAKIGDPQMQVRLLFSLSVSLKTLHDNISFSPSMNGFWSLEDDNKLAIFTPAEPWAQNSRYEIRISTSLTDNNEMNIGNSFLSIFTTETEHESPYLLHAFRVLNDGSTILLTPDSGFSGAAELPVENQNWEKDDRLFLVFSKPVDSLLVKNYLSAEDAPSLVMETLPGFRSEFIFRFENTPVYESRFTFRLKPGIKDTYGNESKEEYIFRIFANGKFSKPPALAGIRIPIAESSQTDQQLFFFRADSLFEIIPITDEYYPSGETVKTWIELYFITAENAVIDPFSLMELFRIETSNNVISFSPRRVKTSDFSIIEPHSGYENLQRIEISGNLVNSTNFGIINFHIAAGLRDSLGNRNEKAINIPLIK